MASESSFSIFIRSPIPSSTSSFDAFPRGFLSLNYSLPSSSSSSSSSAAAASSLTVSASKNKRNNNGSGNEKASISSKGFTKKSQKVSKNDPWETLFQQLELDLENDTEEIQEDDITEEDILSFEQELQSVVKELATEVRMKRGNNKDVAEEVNDSSLDEEKNNALNQDEVYDEDLSDDEFEEPRKVHLERWQLKKLAAASEIGRRKVNIKSLAAELQLERDDVISFLKNPPTELLLMLADEAEDETSENEEEELSDEEKEPCDEEANTGEEQRNKLLGEVSIPSDTTNELLQTDNFNKLEYGPRDWIKGKRLRKVHIATLERVYKRTKWPTNAMVESIVQVTRLPRRRVLEWFDEQRKHAGSKDPPKQTAILRKTWKKPINHSFATLD